LGFKKSSSSRVYAPRFQPVGDLEKLGFKSRVYEPRFHPAGDWSSKVELNSSWSGVLKSKFSPWLGKYLDSKIWVSQLIYTPVLMSNVFRINILEDERYKPQTGLRIHHISKVKKIFI